MVALLTTFFPQKKKKDWKEEEGIFKQKVTYVIGYSLTPILLVKMV